MIGLGRLVGRVSLAFALAAGSLAGGCAASKASERSDAGHAARSKMAHELVARGDWAQAFALLDDMHRERPDDADVLTLRGIVFRERGLFPDAEGDLKAALKLTPDSAEAHAALGI